MRRVVIGSANLIAFAVLSYAQDTVYFRQHGGLIKDGTRLPEDLQQAELVWRAPLPPGNSTPSVHAHGIYLTTWQSDDSELATVKLDARTGRRLWKQVVPLDQVEAFHPVGSPASSSVACTQDRVVCFFGSYGLLCYDHDGETIWQKQMGPFQDEFGAASSPIVVGDAIILNEDHDVDSFVTAVQIKDGKTIWKTAREDATRSYSTPVLMPSEDGPQVIVAGSLRLTAYNATTGERRWWMDGLSRIVDSTPSVVGDSLYVATWTPGGDEINRIRMEPLEQVLQVYDQDADGQIAKRELPAGSPVSARFFRMDLNQDGKLNQMEWDRHRVVFERAQNVAMSITPQGTGRLGESCVKWVARRGLPTVASSVVYKDILYMVKDSGVITGLDAKTGEILKQVRAKGRGNYYASVIAGDGKLYFCSEGGVVTIVRAGEDLAILASYDFDERIMATPVARNGFVYVRTDQALYCFASK